MTKIGDLTHIPDIKAKKCKQCGHWFYYQRASKVFCGVNCRNQAKRGVPPEDKNPYVLNEYEQLSALISTENPLAFHLLEKLKDKYGFRSVEMCLDVVIALIQ